MIRILHTADWHFGKKLDQHEEAKQRQLFFTWLFGTIKIVNSLKKWRTFHTAVGENNKKFSLLEDKGNGALFGNKKSPQAAAHPSPNDHWGFHPVVTGQVMANKKSRL